MKFFGKLGELIRKYDDGHNFTCDVCGREVFGGERVCKACRALLPYNDAEICPLCGRRVKEAGVCLECKSAPPKFNLARSVFLHEGEAARLVVRFKRGSKYLYRALAELAMPLLSAEFYDCDYLTFVPMTKKAERKRGYNQARLLAEELSRRSGIPFLEAAVKTRETKPQKTLGRREREQNLKGCFRVIARTEVKRNRILVIDDTLTTGSTVSELAAALKRAGAVSVLVLTFTSVEDKYPFGKPPKPERKKA